MAFHLVCVHPFADYKRGQKITDADEIARLMKAREKHFVKVSASVNAAPEEINVGGVEYEKVPSRRK